MQNKHNQRIPLEVLEQAQMKISEATRILKPYLLALTPSDKMEIPKMGPKTLQFVEKSHEYASRNAELVPQFLSMEDFGVDFSDARGLWALLNSARQLQDGIADTQMTAGSEAFQAALVFYNSVKAASAQNVHGAKAIYEELKSRFPRGKRRQSDSEPSA